MRSIILYLPIVATI